MILKLLTENILFEEYKMSCHKQSATLPKKCKKQNCSSFSCSKAAKPFSIKGQHAVKEDSCGLFKIETSCTSPTGPCETLTVNKGDRVRFWSAGGMDITLQEGSVLTQLEPMNIVVEEGDPNELLPNGPLDPSRPKILIDTTTSEMYCYEPTDELTRASNNDKWNAVGNGTQPNQITFRGSDLKQESVTKTTLGLSVTVDEWIQNQRGDVIGFRYTSDRPIEYAVKIGKEIMSGSDEVFMGTGKITNVVFAIRESLIGLALNKGYMIVGGPTGKSEPFLPGQEGTVLTTKSGVPSWQHPAFKNNSDSTAQITPFLSEGNAVSSNNSAIIAGNNNNLKWANSSILSGSNHNIMGWNNLENIALAQRMIVRDIPQRQSVEDAHATLPVGHLWRLENDGVVRVVFANTNFTNYRHDFNMGTDRNNTGVVSSPLADDGTVAGSNLTNQGSVSFSNDTHTFGEGQSLLFSGNASDFVADLSNALLSGITNNFAIEVWLKSDTNVGDAIIFYIGNPSANGFGLRRSGSQWVATLGGVSDVVGGNVEVGKWTHLAIVRDGGFTSLYVDFERIGITSSALAPNAPSTQTLLGGNQSGGLFQGLIDRVRVFTFTEGTLSSDDFDTTPTVLEPPPPTEGLIQNFETFPQVEFLTFGGGFGGYSDNPNPSSLNSSVNTFEVFKPFGAEFFTGYFFNLFEPLNFNAYSKIAVKVFTFKQSPVLIKLKVETDNPNIAAEVDSFTTTFGEWEELVFDFTGLIDTNNQYIRLVTFPDFGNVGDDTSYWFDDYRMLN